MTTQHITGLAIAFSGLLAELQSMTADLPEEAEELLRQGAASELTNEEAARLLSKIIEALRTSALVRGDAETIQHLSSTTEEAIGKVLQLRDRLTAEAPKKPRLALLSRHGWEVGPVRPAQYFHGHLIPMDGGYVNTVDLQLWRENERLDIHLNQFKNRENRPPTRDELIDIMLSRANLAGIVIDSQEDQFKIQELARSIAVNGVRRPPILDAQDRLLDGNRRVAACRYITESNEFNSEEKSRAAEIFVWRLTEHATEDDRHAVVVSLNFESDCKEKWPEYVKARKVFDEWHAMLQREGEQPSVHRQRELKKELSRKYALGRDASVVNRYIRMVQLANDFERYQVTKVKKDQFEVKHRANKYFQYFDELTKGTQPGSVAITLNQDDSYRHLVFDLLYEGKFNNWRDIRALNAIYLNEDAMTTLKRARQEEDVEEAKDIITNAVTVARAAKAEVRELGANTRIETFVKWLEDLPIKAFRETIKPPNLRRLLSALKLVEQHAQAATEQVESA